MGIFSFFLAVVASVLEAFVLPIPLVLLAVIFFAVYQKKPWIFFVAIFAGLVLDSLFFRPIGVTSLFFLFVLGTIFLYGRKFEIQNMAFILTMIGVSSLLYLLIFGASNLFLQLFLSIICCLVCFAGMFVFQKIRIKYGILQTPAV